MKRFGILVLCLMVVMGFHSMAVAKTLKIGTLSPLTGPYAQDGTDILQGAKTAASVFEKAGLLDENKKINQWQKIIGINNPLMLRPKRSKEIFKKSGKTIPRMGSQSLQL